MADVTTRRARGFVLADCVDCGEREPSGNDLDHARQRRWARAHAKRHPGHRVHVVLERTTVYESSSSEEADRG